MADDLAKDSECFADDRQEELAVAYLSSAAQYILGYAPDKVVGRREAASAGGSRAGASETQAGGPRIRKVKVAPKQWRAAVAPMYSN